MSLDWDAIAAYALSLPGTERSTSYGRPAIKANGRPIVSPSREHDSFVLHIDQQSKATMIETDPDSFWQTPHYEGWPTVLVRYDTADPERVLALIGRARDQAAARKPSRSRKASRKAT